ncbi:hypothetical protein [Pararhizobium antarcticum]|uniref:Uncharacterized protein n=1 Tax=Pararhizobium antarcticum TaxID=1798805 RepID=A0A657LRV1_9HYPH|nr:hypothetical protein [Pararhizobium antarcticum]OJF96453.1 hypothetical protein AX760_17480 [Pararhizobium antarcticum]OJF97992.1 hypothetical protein AX761_13440 [Rhizobium sp. 58]
MMEFGGRKFESVRGSDVERDGMYIEVSEKIGNQQRVMLEVFYSDEDNRMTFTAFEKDLPFELIEQVAQTARERLTPVTTMGATR